MFDFNDTPNRCGTESVKWDGAMRETRRSKLLPMWVADMDFPPLPEVRDAVCKWAREGVYGYTLPSEELYSSIIEWQKKRHDLSLKKEDILFMSGVVPSINLCIQAFTREGDKVLLPNPVYPPFLECVKRNNRIPVQIDLVERNGHYEMDFDLMESLLNEHPIQLFLLCNPHNPGGRVWTKEELNKMGSLCEKENILVVSDEIHGDLILPGNSFTSFFNAGEDFEKYNVVLSSATKTFNLAGTKNSMIFCKNEFLRHDLQRQIEQNQQGEISTVGYLATQTAFEYGQKWLEALLQHIQKNVEIVEQELIATTSLSWMKPEGTYLAWLDFSNYGMSDDEIMNLLVKKGNVLLNSGVSFGENGTQHMRMNLATSEMNVREGIRRIKWALENRRKK